MLTVKFFSLDNTYNKRDIRVWKDETRGTSLDPKSFWKRVKIEPIEQIDNDKAFEAKKT